MRFTRTSAFLAHLAISVGIFLALLAVLVFGWYRWPLFPIDGGWNGIKIIAGVDLVLGPLLTLVVFKPGKPKLKLDMTIIAAIQTAALVAGAWVVHGQRPVVLVLTETHFFCMSLDLLPRTGLSLDDLARFDDKPYPIAVVTLPDDEDARQKERATSLGQGGMHVRGDLFAPRNAQYLSDIGRHSIDMAKLVANDVDATAIFERFVAEHGPATNFFFVPVFGRTRHAIFALDRVRGDIVERLDIAPPKIGG
jgi:hypothetical protein